ncbi:MAG: DUF4344 domain-containing metallopeptidase [Xanthobacteraceae bacterium]
MRAIVSAGLGVLLLLLLVLQGEAQDAAGGKPIPIEYVAPTNPAHQPIYETLKSNRILERFQEFFRVFPMSKPFGFKLAGCDGEANAWYEPDDRMITVCYEYIEEVRKNAPGNLKARYYGVSPDDTVTGPVVETFLHEAAHALFAVLEIPILGREEDAADQVAAYILLQLGDDLARRMISGVAYNLAIEAKHSRANREALPTSTGCPLNGFTIWSALPTARSRNYSPMSSKRGICLKSVPRGVKTSISKWRTQYRRSWDRIWKRRLPLR